MHALIALDIGTRRTGVAYADTAIGIAHPRSTLCHVSSDELVSQVQSICAEEGIATIVVGLPLLPSGAEGAQASFVRSVVALLGQAGVHCLLLDERYTSPRNNNEGDGDAHAACALLDTYLSRSNAASS